MCTRGVWCEQRQRAGCRMRGLLCVVQYVWHAQRLVTCIRSCGAFQRKRENLLLVQSWALLLPPSACRCC